MQKDQGPGGLLRSRRGNRRLGIPRREAAEELIACDKRLSHRKWPAEQRERRLRVSNGNV